MNDVYSEISKEKYDDYASRPYGEWKSEVEKTLPTAWICGYGYYGSRLATKDGKYYLVHSIGSSCD